MERNNHVQRLAEILVQCCGNELERVMFEEEEQRHYGIEVNFIHLASAEPDIADLLTQDPSSLILLLEESLIRAQSLVFQAHSAARRLCVKRYVHPRLTGLPQHLLPQPQPCKPRLSQLASKHVNKLISISGRVVKLGPVTVMDYSKEYLCNKCRRSFTLRLDSREGCGFSLPSVCPISRDCGGPKFTPSAHTAYTDKRDIKVQEKTEGMHMDSVPGAVTVQLQHDLVHCCQPGDEIEVSGVALPIWSGTYPSKRCTAELTIRANWVAVRSKSTGSNALLPEHAAMFEEFWAEHAHEPLMARDEILQGVCPQIYGMFPVKLATMLMLIGGVAIEGRQGAPATRGNIHMLLVGDPGTGKSQILKFASKVSPRSVVASGKGSSGVGLTVAAVKDGADWSLEAGALVLADGGLCCIDEFDGIREAEQAAIHQAMEQQCIHVAKASIQTVVRTRTSVLGVTNPRGAYKADLPLEKNVGIAPTLLTRFDLILLLLDRRNHDWQAVVAKHILSNHQGSGPGAGPTTPWTVGTLQLYLMWVQATFQPALTTEAEEVITAYWKHVRSCGDHSVTRTSVRNLEGVVRLSQAHARLCARAMVTLQDAVVAVSLMESTLPDAYILPCHNLLDSTFSPDPDQQAAEETDRLLNFLGLTHLMGADRH